MLLKNELELVHEFSDRKGVATLSRAEVSDNGLPRRIGDGDDDSLADTRTGSKPCLDRRRTSGNVCMSAYAWGVGSLYSLPLERRTALAESATASTVSCRRCVGVCAKSDGSLRKVRFAC